MNDNKDQSFRGCISCKTIYATNLISHCANCTIQLDKFKNIATFKEIVNLTETLAKLRLLRDERKLGSEIRQRYNNVCNQLDILISKIAEVKSE